MIALVRFWSNNAAKNIEIYSTEKANRLECEHGAASAAGTVLRLAGWGAAWFNRVGDVLGALSAGALELCGVWVFLLSALAAHKVQPFTIPYALIKTAHINA